MLDEIIKNIDIEIERLTEVLKETAVDSTLYEVVIDRLSDLVRIKEFLI